MMTAAETRTHPKRSILPPTLVYMLENQLFLAAMVWAAFVLVMLGLALALGRWSEVETSIWQNGSIGAVPWYVLFIGSYLGYNLLPLHVTHGQTRREFNRQAIVFVAIFAAAIAGLVVVGYLLEAPLYALTGWERSIETERLYSSPWQLHLIFVEMWLILTLWCAAGVFLGAAFYRDGGLGMLALIPAIFIAGVAGIAFGGDWGPFGWTYDKLMGEERVRPLFSVLIYLACIAAVLGLTWPVVRDIPIRSKSP